MLLSPKFLLIQTSESSDYLENPEEVPETAQSLTDANQPEPLWHILAAEYAVTGKHWLFILGFEVVRENYCDLTQE